MSKDGSNKFSQAAGQLTKFQEDVEEMAEALQVAGSALAETEKASLREAQAKQRSAQEDELARDMAEMSYQMQDSSQGKESNDLLIHTKARIKQIQLAIGEAMT